MSEMLFHHGAADEKRTVEPVLSVKEKLQVFPEVHLYKQEPAGTKQRVGKRPAGNNRSRTGRLPVERIFTYIIIFLTAVLIIELVFHFIVSPRLLIKKVQIKIEDTLGLSNEEILQLAGIGKKTYLFNLNIQDVEKKLTGYPLIKKAVVKKKFPDTISIDVFGRSPLAVSLVETDQGAVPVVFDEDGVVFEIGRSITHVDKLVLSGIKFHDIQLGMHLPGELKGFLQDLKTLREKAPILYSRLSEIKLIKKSGSNFEALLYTKGYNIPVRIGDSLDEHQLKYMFMILDVVTKKEFFGKIKELDLRTGRIVYKMKEG